MGVKYHRAAKTDLNGRKLCKTEAKALLHQGRERDMKFNPFGYDPFSEKGSFEDAFTSFVVYECLRQKRDAEP